MKYILIAGIDGAGKISLIGVLKGFKFRLFIYDLLKSGGLAQQVRALA